MTQEINEILLQYKKIERVNISAFNHKLPTKVSKLLNNMDNLIYLSISDYLQSEEFKNLVRCESLEELRLDMWDARDIDFRKFKKLKICTIVMNKYQSTKEQIKLSKKYISELEKEGIQIKFEFQLS